MTDELYMRQALTLAKKGCGWVNPNPMVGAVIVKNGQIIGSGYHQKYGDLHAERNALASCRESPKDATMYVTLEPCCHYGKTGPCTTAILQSGIRRVVIGSKDPQSSRLRKGHSGIRKSRNSSYHWCPQGRMQSSEYHLFPLHSDQNSLYHYEICHDSRWKNRCCFR